MSTKQFISAEKHLAKLGLTVQQALNFIVANVNADQPEVIYAAARQAGVTNAMLSEITGVSTTVIHDYFKAAGRDPVELDYTSLVVNFDLGSLETLVAFNDHTGILSNTSLRETVQPLLQFPEVYDSTWREAYPFQKGDGIYDAEELGVGHLNDVPATDESIESLFYGTLINIFSALDESELNQIIAFPDDGNSEDFQVLLLEVLSETPSPVIWSDEQLADLVTKEGVDIIDEYWFSGSSLIGVIDHSYLGLAAM